jgi:tRNA pseudouridine65 synthase
VLRLRRAPVGPGLPALTLLELIPRTGRSHQLRVQCAQRHLPIVGDATYGDFTTNRTYAKHGGPRRLCLHSHHTDFRYQWQGREHTFAATAPTPPEMLAVF